MIFIMKFCESCQQIPEQYDSDLCKESLPEAISKFMDEHKIRTTMQTKERVICSRCAAVYDLDIYTEVFRVEFSLKRLK